MTEAGYTGRGRNGTPPNRKEVSCYGPGLIWALRKWLSFQ